MTYQDSTAVEEQPKKKRRGNVLLILLSVLLIAGGLTFGLWGFLSPSATAPEGALPDMEGRIIVPDDPSATTTEFLEQAQMVEDDGGDGFVVPAVNLDVPLGSINEVEGVMNPPSFTSVFWIRNRGVSLEEADKGTVYMVTHAVYGGTAPGNYLQSNQEVALKPGDIIKVNNRQYQFEEARIIDKGLIPNEADLWTDEPGRLILVTCQIRPQGGTAVNNMVIIARLVS